MTAHGKPDVREIAASDVIVGLRLRFRGETLLVTDIEHLGDCVHMAMVRGSRLGGTHIWRTPAAVMMAVASPVTTPATP